MFEAHYNANGDLLVTISDRSQPWPDACFGTQAEWMDASSDSYVEGWSGNIANNIEVHIGRALTGAERAELDNAIGEAVETDGVAPK